MERIDLYIFIVLVILITLFSIKFKFDNYIGTISSTIFILGIGIAIFLFYFNYPNAIIEIKAFPMAHLPAQYHTVPYIQKHYALRNLEERNITVNRLQHIVKIKNSEKYSYEEIKLIFEKGIHIERITNRINSDFLNSFALEELESNDPHSIKNPFFIHPSIVDNWKNVSSMKNINFGNSCQLFTKSSKKTIDVIIIIRVAKLPYKPGLLTLFNPICKYVITKKVTVDLTTTFGQE